MSSQSTPLSQQPLTIDGEAIPLLHDQFVDMTFITQYTGLTDKWFYQLIQRGEFPRPVKFGRSSRWLRSEVEQWVQERIRLSRGTDQATQ